MKHFILLLLFTGFCAGAKAQFPFGDSLKLPNDSFPNVPYKMLPMLDRYCYYKDTVITTDSSFAALKERCKVIFDSVDFSKQVVMFRSEGGDCHARYYNRLYLDTAKKTMNWIIYNVWGGCRAGGLQDFLMVAQKPPEGYTIRLRTFMMDREDDLYGWWNDEGR